MGSVFHNLKTDYYEQNNNTCIFNSIQFNSENTKQKFNTLYFYCMCHIGSVATQGHEFKNIGEKCISFKINLRYKCFFIYTCMHVNVKYYKRCQYI